MSTPARSRMPIRFFLAAAIGLGAGVPASRGADVDFYRDLYPILKSNCIACHNKTTTKAALNMETPESMRKGGDAGPGLIPGKGAESLVYQAAAHIGDMEMPPKGNKSGASALRPDELTLFKTWIDQGAKSSVNLERRVVWQPLPPGLHPIYGVAITRDGRYAACARANQIFVYDLATRTLADRLSDSALDQKGAKPAFGTAHRALIQTLAFSPDGTRIASGAFRELKIWKAESPSETIRPADKSKNAAISVLSEDGTLLVSAGDDGEVRAIDLASGKTARTITTGLKKPALPSLSPDASKVAITTADGSLEIRSVRDGGKIASKTVSPNPTAIAWTGDGKAVAIAGTDKVVKLWTISGDTTKELTGPASPVMALGTGRVGVVAATASKLYLWKPGESKPSMEIPAGVTAAIACSPDGKRIATARNDGVVQVWDAGTGKPVIELSGDASTAAKLAELDLSIAAETLETAFQKQEAARIETINKGLDDLLKKANDNIAGVKKELVDRESAHKQATAASEAAKKSVASLTEQVAKAPKDKPDAAAEAALREAQAKLAAAGMAETAALNAVKIKQTHLKDAEAEAKNYVSAQTSNKTAIAAANSAATRSTLAKDKATAQIAEVKKAAAARNAKPIAVRFSNDGEMLIAVLGDGSVNVWGIASGLPILRREGTAAVKQAGIASLPDGFAVARADGSVTRVPTSRRWILERTIGGDSADAPFVDRVNAVRFSPDGKLLAAGSGEPTRSGDVSVWEVASGKPIHSWKERHADAVLSLDFSPDGKRLASGGADKVARVTELSNGKVVNLLEGHTHHVLGLSYRADGRILATAGADGTVVVWDMISGERKKKIEGWGKEVTAIEFLGASNQAVTSSGDNQVRIVDDTGGQVRSFAKLPEFMQSAASATTSNLIAAGGEDSVLRLWNRLTGLEVATFGPPDSTKSP